MKRTLWYEPRLDPTADPKRIAVIRHLDDVYGGVNPERANEFGPPPNLIGSLVTGGTPGMATDIHMPVIDIDRMPGNYHLYIDKPMAWPIFVDLIKALLAAGIIERGWADATIKQGCAYVRVPGVRKVGTEKSHEPKG